MIYLYLLLALVFNDSTAEEGSFLGCYRDMPSTATLFTNQYSTVEQCIRQCKSKYYRYASLRLDGLCICGNYLGEKLNDTLTCNEYCNSFCDNRQNLTDAYLTGNLLPGPPRNIQINNITSTSMRTAWDPPEAHTKILSYGIKFEVIHTYSHYKPMNKEWFYSGDTFQTELASLQPATKYNLTIRAISTNGSGIEASTLVETLIAEPNNLPEKPVVVKKENTKITVRLSTATNDNGPVSSYYIAVIDRDSNQIFDPESVKSYHEALKDDNNYYIAAELDEKALERDFVVGDGRYYRKYYNAPLKAERNYDILLGIVSSFNGITKVRYSENLLDNVTIVNQNNNELGGDSPAVIIGLSIAIGLLSFMLIAGIIGFIILRSKVTNRRQRLSDNQELTLQGPMIEVENNGYIPEEEYSKVNHYKNLKQKLRTIPYSQLKIEPTNLLGIGRFGRVNSGSIYENNTLIPVAVYSISDKKLGTENRKSMLRELDALIRTGKHDNIISLFGTCETPQLVFVVLEYVSMNLKDLLLGSRDSLPDRFSNMSESQALDIAINVAKGMAHLEAKKIVHKQICARSIMVSNGFVPKISGYGLAQFYSHNNLPDFTRWTALEVFKGQSHSTKSDVWSFACLLWEICVLGGTPYGNFPNNEVPERVIKGLRLPQMQYFSDDLYQIILNCWQIDMDERPNFLTLAESLQELKQGSLILHLSFNLYSNFQYEQFYPDMEIAVRPVF